MPSYVLKEAPDSEYYIVWSDIVEAPICGGSRADVRDFLLTQQDSPFGGRSNPDERLDRADANGTSAKWPDLARPAYGWDDDYGIYQQQGTVTRPRMFELMRRLVADENADVSDLIDPFDD